jgi:hypothetical protein
MRDIRSLPAPPSLPLRQPLFSCPIHLQEHQEHAGGRPRDGNSWLKTSWKRGANVIMVVAGKSDPEAWKISCWGCIKNRVNTCVFSGTSWIVIISLWEVLWPANRVLFLISLSKLPFPFSSHRALIMCMERPMICTNIVYTMLTMLCKCNCTNKNNLMKSLRCNILRKNTRTCNYASLYIQISNDAKNICTGRLTPNSIKTTCRSDDFNSLDIMNLILTYGMHLLILRPLSTSNWFHSLIK